MQIRSQLCAAGIVLSALVAATPAGAADFDLRQAHTVVREAKATAQSIPRQAEALARLIWLEPGNDPLIAAIAREDLVGFGYHAIPALRSAVPQVPARFTADIAAALVEARLRISEGVSPEYSPGLEAALWFGSPTAKRIAMRDLAYLKHFPAVLPMIDAAYDYPELVPSVIRNLVVMRDARARFFLEEVLNHGWPDDRELAARALADIGGMATQLLREAAISDDVRTRIPAIDALLPSAGLDDLTTLHEYVATRSTDNTEVVERVRQRAIQLEFLLEQQLAGEAEPED